MTRGNPADARRRQGFGNMSDLAALLGVSVPTIREAIAKGRIERDPGGWLHLETQAAAFRASSVGSRNGHGAKPATSDQPAAAAAGGDDQPADSATATTGGETFAAARTRREIAQADLAETKARETRGELVSVAETQRAWFGLARSLRSRLLALPDVLAGRLVGKSRAEIRRVLNAEIRTALTDLSDDAPAAVGRD